MFARCICDFAERLVEYFSAYGDVQECVIMCDPQNQRYSWLGLDFYHLSRNSSAPCRPHTLHDVLVLVPMWCLLIGACNPMLCPFHLP